MVLQALVLQRQSEYKTCFQRAHSFVSQQEGRGPDCEGLFARRDGKFGSYFVLGIHDHS